MKSFLKTCFVIALSVCVLQISGQALTQNRGQRTDTFSREMKAQTERRAKTWPRPTRAQLSGMLNSWLKGIEKSHFDYKAFFAKEEWSATVLFSGAEDHNFAHKDPKKVFGLLVVTYEQETPLRSWVLFNRSGYGYLPGLDATGSRTGRINNVVVIFGPYGSQDRLDRGVVAPIDLRYDVFGSAGVDFQRVSLEQFKKLPPGSTVKVECKGGTFYYKFQIEFI